MSKDEAVLRYKTSMSLFKKWAVEGLISGEELVAIDTKVGLDASATEYDLLAAEECARYESALRAIAVENEPNPAKVNWNC